jgi:hypothetical protein
LKRYKLDHVASLCEAESIVETTTDQAIYTVIIL